MKLQKMPSVESQQISIESAFSLADLHKKLKSTPMYFIESEQRFNLKTSITIGNKMPMLFEQFDVCFCSECESSWDDDIESCTNPDCLNCSIHDNPYDTLDQYALA